MGQRLTQIATRTGDDGSTGLGDGTRVPKDHLRVQAMGDADELNSSLGVLLAEPLPDDVRELLVTIQHELFNLGGELSIPGYQLLKADAVLRLDEALAHYNAQLPRLKEFILPAGTRSAALAHVSRTVAGAHGCTCLPATQYTPTIKNGFTRNAGTEKIDEDRFCANPFATDSSVSTAATPCGHSSSTFTGPLRSHSPDASEWCCTSLGAPASATSLLNLNVIR
jgi:ATP:cob(I)alamin adenosyltransferase